jgi:DNA-binding transcriptional LysR family regulator
VPEILELLARRGAVAAATATADSPATVAALVRSGIGVGLLTAVAAHGVAGGDDGLVAVPLDDAALARRVGVYWYDALLDTDLGRRLLDGVLTEPAPPGAVPVAPGPGGPGAAGSGAFAACNGVAVR